MPTTSIVENPSELGNPMSWFKFIFPSPSHYLPLSSWKSHIWSPMSWVEIVFPSHYVPLVESTSQLGSPMSWCKFLFPSHYLPLTSWKSHLGSRWSWPQVVSHLSICHCHFHLGSHIWEVPCHCLPPSFWKSYSSDYLPLSSLKSPILEVPCHDLKWVSHVNTYHFHRGKHTWASTPMSGGKSVFPDGTSKMELANAANTDMGKHDYFMAWDFQHGSGKWLDEQNKITSWHAGKHIEFFFGSRKIHVKCSLQLPCHLPIRSISSFWKKMRKNLPKRWARNCHVMCAIKEPITKLMHKSCAKSIGKIDQKVPCHLCLV